MTDKCKEHWIDFEMLISKCTKEEASKKFDIWKEENSLKTIKFIKEFEKEMNDLFTTKKIHLE